MQTEDYLRAVIAGAHLGDAAEDMERRVALRMGRQALLERIDGFLLWAVVEEAALRRPVGGPKVLRAQLERLIEATALPTVTLQVLPLRVSAHAAMVGAFNILRFPSRTCPMWSKRGLGIGMTQAEGRGDLRRPAETRGSHCQPNSQVAFSRASDRR